MTIVGRGAPSAAVTARHLRGSSRTPHNCPPCTQHRPGRRVKTCGPPHRPRRPCRQSRVTACKDTGCRHVPDDVQIGVANGAIEDPDFHVVRAGFAVLDRQRSEGTRLRCCRERRRTGHLSPAFAHSMLSYRPWPPSARRRPTLVRNVFDVTPVSPDGLTMYPRRPSYSTISSLTPCRSERVMACRQKGEQQRRMR